VSLLLPVLVPARAAEKPFSVPEGDAAATLAQFADQLGEQLVYPSAEVRGVRTRAVEGRMAGIAALRRMLAGTPLEALHDERTGALAVRRLAAAPAAAPPPPNPHRCPPQPRFPEPPTPLPPTRARSRTTPSCFPPSR
jgi:hypothetical protein